MLQKRAFAPLIIVALFSMVLAGCSAGPSAPVVPTPSAIATVETSVPAIEQSPLQPGTGVSPLNPSGALSYTPVSADECEALRKSVADTLKQDKPISACAVKPEQQNYVIIVNVAEAK